MRTDASAAATRQVLGAALAALVALPGVTACSSSTSSTAVDAGADAPSSDSDASKEASTLEAGIPPPASDGGSPAIDGGAGVAFCDGTYGAMLTAFGGCCASGDVTTSAYKFISAVYTLWTQTCESQLASAIAKGRVTFDASAAQACTSAIQGTVDMGWCWNRIVDNQPNPPPFGSATCTKVVTGLQAAGEPCAADLECQDGLTCVGWSATDGACQTPGAAGEACEQKAGAASPPAYIDYGFGDHPACATGAYCNDSVCTAQVGAGAKCTGDPQCTTALTCHLGVCGATGPAPAGGSCLGTSDCQNGLYCAPGEGGASPSTCEPREPGGGECTANGSECKGYCALPDGATTGACTAICGSG